MSAMLSPVRATSLRWYWLAMLTLVYALNQADRFVMSALIEPIKSDLHLSDTGVGLLSGVALAIFYVIAGLPVAVFADRSNRRNIVTASLAAWSALTALCGLTRTYTELLLVRVGVGVGEAGGTAPSHAMLSDIFPARQRARALAIYGIGVSIGVALASFGGTLSEHIGWRSVFFVLGVPGLILAVVIQLTVPEPRRGRQDSIAANERTTATLRQTWAFAIAQPTLRHQLFATFLFCLSSWGLIWWLPAFLERSHGMSVGQAGTALGAIHGIGGTIGLVASVVLMRWLEGRDPLWLARTAAILLTVATVPAAVAVSVGSTALVVGALWCFISVVYGLYGPMFALLQNSTPPQMRTQIAAISMLVVNVANLVVAPLAVGWVSDMLAPSMGAESLRAALLPLALIGFWGALHYWLAAPGLRHAMESAGTA